MEITVTEDCLLYCNGEFFKKGDVICTVSTPILKPAAFVPLNSTFTTQDLKLQWELEYPFFVCFRPPSEIWFPDENAEPCSDLKDYRFEMNATMEIQEFIVSRRPDLIGDFKYVYPELKAKYQHEVELTKVDV